MMAWESLLSESQTSNLTQAQNELSAFTLIFFIILFVNMRYAPLSFSTKCDSLRSVTAGSIVLLAMRLLVGWCVARTTIGGEYESLYLCSIKMFNLKSLLTLQQFKFLPSGGEVRRGLL